MYKTQKIITVFVLILNYTYPQTNLVPNPSFEGYNSCPDNTDQINRAIGWFSCKETPDYFNSCATATFVSVPNSYLGFQEPYSGNAYAGIFCYQTNFSYREVIGVQLTSPLIIGQKYFASFRANLTLDYLNGGNGTTNKLGLKLTKTQFSFSNPPPINNFAHIVHNAFITDTLNWTKVFGSFIADSAYKFVMIGNFFDDANTSLIKYGGATDTTVNFLIDQVVISTDSLLAANPVGVKENKEENLFYFFPNPIQSNLNITLRSRTFIKTLAIINALGKNIYSENIFDESESVKLNLGFLCSGYYILEIETKQSKTKYKLLKSD